MNWLQIVQVVGKLIEIGAPGIKEVQDVLKNQDEPTFDDIMDAINNVAPPWVPSLPPPDDEED